MNAARTVARILIGALILLLTASLLRSRESEKQLQERAEFLEFQVAELESKIDDAFRLDSRGPYVAR